eukprot:jgi/Mesen1/5825/ME000297S05027
MVNERGQVDVWSPKCLPAGTVHLRLPRLVPIANFFGIDFAPAMVGFEVRGGRSVPRYEGIVVCREFKGVIRDAYEEEEARRQEELLARRKEEAIGRWCLLLRSIATRQRLRTAYQDASEQRPLQVSAGAAEKIDGADIVGQNVEDAEASAGGDFSDLPTGKLGEYTDVDVLASAVQEKEACERSQEVITHGEEQASKGRDGPKRSTAPHEHHFSADATSYDEESGIRTKYCFCGFVVEVEEL